MYKKILVPLDGSRESELALERADVLCGQQSDCELVLLQVVEVAGLGMSSSHAVIRALERQQEAAVEYLEQVGNRLDCKQVKRMVVKGSMPAEVIARIARENEVDLIVMTCHGRSAFQEFFVGSQTKATIQLSPCSVLVVKNTSVSQGAGLTQSSKEQS